jgi:CDP-alcohol phosphatidyltransferase-like enzyme
VDLRRAADSLSIFRAACGVALPFWSALPLFSAGVISDWLDGPLARRAPSSSHGARLDLEADSLLTLGAAIAAVRHGAPRIVLIAPVARYLIAPARARDDVRWDRVTGVAQMALLGAFIARLPVRWAAIPVTAARCAALAARVSQRGRLDPTAQPAEPR